MQQPLRCVNAIAPRSEGRTVVRRCRGEIVPSTDGKYICSDEGDDIVYNPDVVELYRESPVFHRAEAISKILALLTHLEPKAENSSYPWIDVPRGKEAARVDATTATWDVHFLRNDHPYETQPTHISTESDDTEAVAYAIAEILQAHQSAGG